MQNQVLAYQQGWQLYTTATHRRLCAEIEQALHFSCAVWVRGAAICCGRANTQDGLAVTTAPTWEGT